DFLNKKVKLFQEIAAKKSINIQANITNDLYVQADPLAIDRLINNLLDNSIKYTQPAGLIELSLTTKENQLSLLIRDTGIGIAEQNLALIFQPYYQLAHKKTTQGIGMGLFITKRIIDSIPGQIKVTSQVNQGTCFTITFTRYLPENNKFPNGQIRQTDLIAPVEINPQISLKEEAFDPQKSTLLLVDDNKEILYLLQSGLKNHFNILYAFNGKNALEKLKQIPKPDVIISDIMMDQMDGHEFFLEFLKNDELNFIPFIFLTAKTTIEEKLKSLSEGAVDYICKPFLVEEIMVKIESLLEHEKRLTRENISKMEKKIHSLFLDLNAQQNQKTTEQVKLNNLVLEHQLSNREKEVLEKLTQGLQNKEIAYDLNISVRTIDNHVHNIYRKLNVQNRIELINFINNY
ncbi:MAG: ATP-binding protein, partial [Spirochaetes bacterium]|nr:ATP-binding protein [Spirochaetota bacterium]